MESALNVALFLVKILKSWLAENGVVNRLHAELKTNIISSKSEMDGLYLENSLYYFRKGVSYSLESTFKPTFLFLSGWLTFLKTWRNQVRIRTSNFKIIITLTVLLSPFRRSTVARKSGWTRRWTTCSPATRRRSTSSSSCPTAASKVSLIF